MEACPTTQPKRQAESSPPQLTAPPLIRHDHWRRLLPSGLASSVLHLFLLSLAALITVVDVELPLKPMDTRVVVTQEKDYEVRRIEEPKPKIEEPKDLASKVGLEKSLGEKTVPEPPGLEVKGDAQQARPDDEATEFKPIVQPVESAKVRPPDVIYVPTPQAVVEEMLRMAKVQPGNVVMDLGCGDGRIPITAATKFGAWGYGYDIDPDRVKEARANVAKRSAGKVVIEQRDVFKLDLSRADAVTLYLLPSLNVKLIPQLQKMKPGTRIVSHDFDMEGAKPDMVKLIDAADDNGNVREHRIYLWILPLKKEDGVPLDPPEPATPGKLSVTEDEVLWNRLGIRTSLYMPAGLKVDEVKAGSAASRVGIRVGDVLVMLGGYDVHSKRAEAVYLARQDIQSMSFEVVRNGKKVLSWLKPDVWEK